MPADILRKQNMNRTIAVFAFAAVATWLFGENVRLTTLCSAAVWATNFVFCLSSSVRRGNLIYYPRLQKVSQCN